jgi:glycosyltransferase involved in cell wall biosynthesis
MVAEIAVDVVLPVLDEAEALAWVLARMPPGYRPLVVDNGSGDGSGALARALGATVVVEPRRGFGAACAAGLAAAAAPVVAFCDADASLDPGDLPRVAGPVLAGEADLVLGARRPTARGAWPAHARLANRYLARRLRRDTGAPLTDLGPLRAARRVDLLALGIADRRFGWPLEMVARAGAAGWRLREVPVAYRPRTGRSKVTGTVAGTVRAVRDMRAVLRSAYPVSASAAPVTGAGAGGARRSWLPGSPPEMRSPPAQSSQTTSVSSLSGSSCQSP